jgi:hypothetical protein
LVNPRQTGTVVAVVVALAVLAVPGAASAHLRSGTIAVDYTASVLRPVTAAYSAQIYASDHGLTLTVKPGHVVVMLGYLGEPVFRLDRDGLWINVASPTAVAVRLVSRAHAVDAARPRWRLQRARRSVAWHDARTQGLSPGVDQGVWTVPLIVDGHVVTLRGRLHRFPAPALWLWGAVLVCLLLAGASPLLLGRRQRARRAAGALAITAAVASVVTALAFALDAYASPGTWIEGVDAIAFLAVGVGVLWRGPANLYVAATIGTGLMSLALGLLDAAVFLHPVVLAILPGTVMRTIDATVIGAGLTAAGLGCVFYEEITAAARDYGGDLGLPPALADAPDRPAS